MELMTMETARSSGDSAMAETLPGNALTGDVIMARLGVYDLVSTKEVCVCVRLPPHHHHELLWATTLTLSRLCTTQLILRDEELTHVDESCAQALASLEILSLSHNRLTSLDHFEHFTNLIEVRRRLSRAHALTTQTLLTLARSPAQPQL